MNSIILIYEMIPENTYVYHLYVDDETAEKIKSTHLKFVNTSTEDESTDWLSGYLTGKTPLIDVEDVKAGGEPLTVRADSVVVVTGFIM